MTEDFKLYPRYFSPVQALNWYEQIRQQTQWHRVLTADDGTPVPIKRAMAYAVFPEYDTGVYKYAGLRLPSQGFTPALDAIRGLVEANHDDPRAYNSVLLNLYENGKEEIRWHADKEPQLGSTPTIATVNLGASRTFSFRRLETGERTDLLLHSGDLLVMGRECQQRYLHAVLKEKHVTEPRISLTFRQVLPPDLISA